ncbi:hypothetical protein [Deinococcus aetherius]|uniref:hypothetical protein n=1 Tax=Deinococcus aetherius TaxID=200252 RepID=UPI00222FCD98|nr:hypothetical protein [Deinococcus aetherius]
MNELLDQNLRQLSRSEQHRLMMVLHKNFVALLEESELLERAGLINEHEVQSWTEEELAGQIRRARRVVDLVWQEGFSVLAQCYADACGKSGVNFRYILEDLSYLLWPSLREAAIQEKASFFLIHKFLEEFLPYVGKAITRLFSSKWIRRNPVVRFVTLLVALVRFKSRIQSGYGVLPRRPHSIPRTVQPCAP